MDLLTTYNAVTKKMKQIDYQKLWPDFHLYPIALYNQNTVCYKGNLIPKTSEFLANTSINYNNEMIGIWYLQDEIDLDVLTSKLIHETFHAFQNNQNESRFPNEIEALLTYRYDENNLSLKHRENNLIIQLIDTFDQEKLNELINIRQQRKRLYPYEVHYEMSIEQIEGTANFVELQVLKQLNKNKYHAKLNIMKDELLSVTYLIPVRIVSYSTGALLIKILIDNHLEISYDFNNLFYLTHLLNKTKTKEMTAYLSNDIKQTLKDYNQMTKRYLDNSIKPENVVLKGDFQLLGVNVYNARTLSNFIITEYFLMYKDQDKDVILNGDYVIKLSDHQHIIEVYRLIKD